MDPQLVFYMSEKSLNSICCLGQVWIVNVLKQINRWSCRVLYPLLFAISSMVILPRIHFLNQGLLLDLEISFLRAVNNKLQSQHLNLWTPLRMPHLFTSNDPHFGHLWRLLIFDLSLIRWKHFHLIYVIFWIIPIYETFTNHFWQLYRILAQSAIRLKP